MDWVENIKQRATFHKENNPPEDYWEIDVEELLRLVAEVERLRSENSELREQLMEMSKNLQRNELGEWKR